MPGSVGVLSWGNCRGKLVRVRILRRLDVSAVSASIDMEDYFVFGPPAVVASRRRLAWHAVRIHNLCRPMGANEEYCEHIGSMIRACYHTNADPDIPTTMDKVILRDACVKCVGSPADEALCRSIARIMIGMGRSPFVSERRKKKRSRTA